MKISIITVTYNSAKTVRDTLESVKNQDYKDIEHIIVDGVSKDDTLKIISEYPSVSKVISEPDKGIYDAMNKGIRAATGDIIGILNSDDFYFDTHVISSIVDVFQKNENVQSVYGDLIYVDATDTNKIVRYWKPGKASINKIYHYFWQPPHPTFFVKKEVYNKYGLFNLEYKIGADVEFLLRVLYKYRITTFYLPLLMVKMREGGASNKNVANRKTLIKEYYKMFREHQLPKTFYTIPFRFASRLLQFMNFGKR